MSAVLAGPSDRRLTSEARLAAGFADGERRAATIRQCGSAFELAAEHMRWQAAGHAAARDQGQAFASIAQGCKTLILKAARAVASGRAFDAGPLFDDMAASWDRGMAQVADLVTGRL